MPESFVQVTERINLQKIGKTFLLSANGGARHWPEYVSNSIHFDAAIAVALRDAITSMLTPEEAADPQAANEPDLPVPTYQPVTQWRCLKTGVLVTGCPEQARTCADGCDYIPF